MVEKDFWLKAALVLFCVMCMVLLFKIRKICLKFTLPYDFLSCVHIHSPANRSSNRESEGEDNFKKMILFFGITVNSALINQLFIS